MKRVVFLFFMVFVASFSVSAQSYSEDILGGGFLQRKIEFKDDYEGSVVATLVKLEDTTRVSSSKAVLYVHGFNDYFFQEEMAREVSAFGYDFYAVDLRKYGRSLLPYQKVFNVRDIDEYFEDIDSAVHIIKQEGHDTIFLMGHSTGGLITTLYVHNRDKGQNIKGLILNSPFFQQNQSWIVSNVGIPLVSFVSNFFPDVTYDQGYSTAYTESLHKKYGKEWDYDLSLKHESSPDVTFSWLGAINSAQNDIADIKDMPIPVLVMCSDKSTFATEYNASYDNSDAVLNVEHIKKHARHFGANAKIVEIKDALHDIALSRKDVRARFYKEINNFLNK